MLERLRNLRRGAVTGLNATENNLKMTGALMTPFLIGWFFVKIFIPTELYDLSVTILMLGWIVWIIMLYAWAKADAGNYIVFPQSKWKFPDGTCKTFDLKLPPDSWEKIVEFPDGSVGYKVYFSDKFIYDDPDLPYPHIFNCAYWVTPAYWDKAFQRRAFGEFFHRGVFVNKPDCEDISVYVIGFEEREGLTFPVCLINDCAFIYNQALKHMDIPKLMSSSNPFYLLYTSERKRGQKLMQHAGYLEDGLEVASEDSSEDFKKSAERRMESARKRHASIMDVKQSLLTRIFNLKNVAVAMLVILAVFLFGKFVLGVW